MTSSRRWVLARRPQGELSPDDFRLERVALPALEDGQLLVRHRFLSIDPGSRIWLSERPWLRELDPALAPIAVGAPIKGATISEVVQSRSPRFSPGDIVQPAIGHWADQEIVDAEYAQPIDVDPELPLAIYLGVLGHTGLTALLGLMEVSRPCPGETIVVSAAAGAVGSVVAQLARRLDLRVVGIAGSEHKLRWLEDVLQLDRALSHRSPRFEAELASACPDGIDIYFDNVGGHVLDGALANMAPFGRVTVCGLVSLYDTSAPVGPSRFSEVLMRRLTVTGFGVFDFPAERRLAAMGDLARMVRQGALIHRIDETPGLDSAPAALIRTLRGDHVGKTVVRLDA